MSYYIASLKMSAWLNRAGAWTSDLKSAKKFTYDEAVEFAKKRLEQGEPTVFPVPVAMLEAITK